MANKKSLKNIKIESSWLDSNLLMSLTIFLCTYTVLGWAIANDLVHWAKIIHEQSLSLQVVIEEDMGLWITKVIALTTIILISLLLSTPIALITFVFEESLNSDVKAFIAILFWSIVLVFIFCSFDYFADLLVITSTNILLRLDLQKLKYKKWQIFFIIFTLASVGFSFGILLFDLFYNK